MSNSQEKINSKEILKDKLVAAVIESVESMTFTEVILTDKTTPYDEHMVRLRVEIRIDEPFPGEIRLITPLSLAVTFAQNMYNLEKTDVSDALLADVLGEIINIIAGRIMGDLLAADKTFRLNIPETGPDVFIETEASSFTAEFDAEGVPFWMILFGEGFAEFSQ